MKSKILSSCILLLAVAAWQQIESTAKAVTFSVTPTVVSNTYAGNITLQVGGLTNGETVVVQEFLDANTNGVIDSSDWLVQQFQLTDGLASVIGGIVNSNVPGDTTATNAAITAQTSFLTTGTSLPMGARYLYKLSSPGNHFTTPLTNQFSITNVPYSQSITGNVVCSGTNVPNAVVMVFSGPAFESSPIAGAVGNNAGGYSMPLPPGTYNLIAFKSNYVVNVATAPNVVLGSGVPAGTNISLLPATCSISGRVQDAANSSLGLAGLLVFPQSTNNLVAMINTDTNGNFSARVTTNQWKITYDDMQLPAFGYVRVQNRPRVDTTTGSVMNVTLALPKGTAQVYGTVKDAQNHPLAGGGLDAWDDGDVYESRGITDQNGNYAVALIANTWNVQPDNTSSVFTNYIFPQASGIALTNGQALHLDFVGLLATNRIYGYLKDGSNNPISGISVWAQTTNNGILYQPETQTGGDGYYSINVSPGTWLVGVSCGGGNSSLSSDYVCPGGQQVVVTSNNVRLDFTALLASSQITGYVKDSNNNPLSGVGVYAYTAPNSGNNPYATTDGSGYYSFRVANGSWNVGVICCGNNGLTPHGCLCVGEQITSVSNSTSGVNFTAPVAPYHITGHLRAAGNNPVANVNVNANDGYYNICATTDGSGLYTLYVTNGDWNVNLDCTALGALGYLCPGGQSVTISNANAVVDFSTVQAPYQITGWVRSSSNQPLTNLHVYAYATIGTNYYQSDYWTDGGGNYSLPAANGPWNLGIDCGGLDSGYLCPDEVTVIVAGASVVTNLTIQICGALQILTTSPLPVGQVGSYYDLYLQASSCNPNFNWSLRNGSGPLPLGLQLDSDGELHGTPGTNGTFNFTVQVTDGNNDTTNQALSLTISAAPGDVLDYYVMKLETFRQLDAANLVPDTNHGPFTAKSAIIQSDPDTVPIANLDLPGGAVRGFPPGGSGIELVILDSYPSQAAFDAVYTNGNYTFALATRHNGFQFPVLAVPVAVYPPAQRVSNFAAAQAINPASPFTLQWTNPSDATTNDTIWAFIVDSNGNTVFSTPYPSTNYSTCLRGTATSVVVPTNTFQLGRAYTGVIGFFRRTSVNTTAYPGALGLTLVGVMTDFPMAAPSSLPVLSQPTRISSTQFGFLLSGATGLNYTVLSATNVARPLSNWAALFSTNLSASPVFVQDNQATNRQRFYRVKVGP